MRPHGLVEEVQVQVLALPLASCVPWTSSFTSLNLGCTTSKMGLMGFAICLPNGCCFATEMEIKLWTPTLRFEINWGKGLMRWRSQGQRHLWQPRVYGFDMDLLRALWPPPPRPCWQQHGQCFCCNAIRNISWCSGVEGRDGAGGHGPRTSQAAHGVLVVSLS